METRTQIVTQLVAAMISNNATELSITEMVIFARDIADEIIETTTEEAAQETAVVEAVIETPAADVPEETTSEAPEAAAENTEA